MYVDIYSDLLPTYRTGKYNFHLKIQLFVKEMSDQDADPHWFGSLDPGRIRTVVKSWIHITSLLKSMRINSTAFLLGCRIFRGTSSLGSFTV
jgi:hypothetical protein